MSSAAENKERISWRNYNPPEETRGSWCPLMNQRCMGAVCAWWDPDNKVCGFRTLHRSIQWFKVIATGLLRVIEKRL